MLGKIPNNIIVSKNGKDGKNGTHGYSGSSGGRGGYGSHGEHGTSAQNILLQITANETAITLHEAADPLAHQVLLEQLPSTIVQLSAMGGLGGSGGDGGNGGRGRDGENGRNATTSPGGGGTRGADGGNGEDGGPGGNGGNAGNGGNGGNITVALSTEDTDLLMLIENVEIAGGNPGTPGSGGSGGQGGNGGKGGSSTTSYYTKHDSSTGQPYTAQTHIPGGTAGRNGNNGRHGSPGNRGIAGRTGEYRIRLTDTNAEYRERYALQVHSFNPPFSDDEIIEPNEPLILTNVVVNNTGGMPTPTKYPIRLELKNNQWVTFYSEHALFLRGLPQGENHTFDEPLPLFIKPNSTQVEPNKVFVQSAVLTFNAIVSRVEKPLLSLLDSVNSSLNVQVRYPVEMSLITNVLSVTLTEESPIAIQLRNISTKDVGSTAQRTVTMHLKTPPEYAGKLIWKNKEGSVTQNLQHPWVFNVPLLSAQSSVYISGTISFADASVETYIRIPLIVDLILGANSTNHPMHIQQNISTLHRAEFYAFNPHADLILVTNSNTTRETILSWQAVAAALHTELSIWDASLYGGLNYRYIRQDQGCFFDQLQNKVVIILNNVYPPSNRTTDLLASAELFDAARMNISTYVIGGHVDITQAIIPRNIATDEKVTEKYIIRKPKEEDLQKKAQTFSESLYPDNPWQQRIVTYQYKPEVSESGIGKKYTLGTLEKRTGLLLTAKIAIDDRESVGEVNELRDEDIFNVIKLFPLEKKWKCLLKNPEGKYLTILLQCILSDLADEQNIWTYGEAWDKKKPVDELKSQLRVLNTLKLFCHTKFQPTQPELASKMKELILQYSYLTKKLKDLGDRLSLRHRDRALAAVCKEIVKDILKNIAPGIDKKQLKKERSILVSEEQSASKKTLLFLYRRPYGFRVKFNHDSEAPIVLKKEEVQELPNRANIVEGKYAFGGLGHNSSARVSEITAIEQKCQITSPAVYAYRR